MPGARIAEPEYVRRVSMNRWQARPIDAAGNRVNLGLFPTEWEARRAVRLFLEGKVRPLPKFVRRTDDDPPKYYWHVRLPNVNICCVAVLHDTPEEAAAHCRRFLARLDGPLFGLAALSQKTTSCKRSKL